MPIKHWIFDLDHTLYAPHHNLFAEIDKRMTQFIADYLELDKPQARLIQKDYLEKYGLTLYGLMKHHNLSPQKFLDYVHNIDIEILPPNAALAAALKNLEGRKLIFTNSDRAHAIRVMTQLGVGDLFDGIFDITDADFIPKPQTAPYHRLIEKFAIDPTQAAFFEDRADNLEAAHSCGMTTIWVRHESEVISAPYIDYHTDDLVEFLTTQTINK